ncbi:hypothetical protein FJ366_03265 [Candidatus Dependentiae bacterium]|nr:hypothetical protein [Candidatus Dependentiae bacterium]
MFSFQSTRLVLIIFTASATLFSGSVSSRPKNEKVHPIDSSSEAELTLVDQITKEMKQYHEALKQVEQKIMHKIKHEESSGVFISEDRKRKLAIEGLTLLLSKTCAILKELTNRVLLMNSTELDDVRIQLIIMENIRFFTQKKEALERLGEEYNLVKFTSQSRRNSI